MLESLIKHNRLGQTLIVILFCLFCFCASVFRYLYSGSTQFLFLNWNLFLAAIPWLLSSFLTFKPKLQENKFIVFILFGIWMLFFPNAPYILTDLIHLRLKSAMPLWFNLVYMLSFSWAGLLMGYLSLMDIETFMKRYLNQYVIFTMSTLVLFMAAFGIYLGRFLELNSWDIFRDPVGILSMLKKYFFQPMNHLDTWGLTLFMGTFLNLAYWSLKIISWKKQVLKIKLDVSSSPEE